MMFICCSVHGIGGHSKLMCVSIRNSVGNKKHKNQEDQKTRKKKKIKLATIYVCFRLLTAVQTTFINNCIVAIANEWEHGLHGFFPGTFRK